MATAAPHLQIAKGEQRGNQRRLSTRYSYQKTAHYEGLRLPQGQATPHVQQRLPSPLLQQMCSSAASMHCETALLLLLWSRCMRAREACHNPTRVAETETMLRSAFVYQVYCVF